MYMQQICMLIADHIQVSSFYKRKRTVIFVDCIFWFLSSIFLVGVGMVSAEGTHRRKSHRSALTNTVLVFLFLFMFFFFFCIAFRGGALHDEPKMAAKETIWREANNNLFTNQETIPQRS